MTNIDATADRTQAPTRRASRQRSAVEAFLAEQETFRTAQEIHADLREQGTRVGLATVYRALQAMVDDGEVDVLRTDDGEAAYRRCSPNHHHHLVCRGCGRTVEVEDEPVERWAAKVAAAHGFSDVEHEVEVFGTCAGCR
ncbi:MAG TPA: transcriptional repressor [Actinomycetales bacterium]|nr:transcriptional repressor [Actinomycetales bacterium]